MVAYEPHVRSSSPPSDLSDLSTRDTEVNGVVVFGNWIDVDELDHSLDQPGPTGDRATDVRPHGQPQLEAPQLEAPQLEAPQLEAPQLEAPRAHKPVRRGWGRTLAIGAISALVGMTLVGAVSAAVLLLGGVAAGAMLLTVPVVDVVFEAPAEGESDAQLVVMPDPGFRSAPEPAPDERRGRPGRPGATKPR